MTVKQKLDRLMDLKRIVEALESRLQHLRSGAEGSRNEQKEGARGTSEVDRMAATVGGIESIERLMLIRRPELEELATWAEAQIMQLPMKEQDPMRLHYLDNMEWPDVAAALHYSINTCYVTQRTAILMIERNERQTA